MNIVVGFDPGVATGGIAVLTENRKLTTYMTPRTPSKKVCGRTVQGGIDVNSMCDIVLAAAREVHNAGGGNLLLIHEDVHNIKGSSSGSNFSFGQRKGEIYGLSCAMEVAIPRIYPDVNIIVDAVYSKTWQKHSVDYMDKEFKPYGKTDTKYSSINTAMRLFPDHSFTKERGKVPQDGMTDATLIAVYGMDNIISRL